MKLTNLYAWAAFCLCSATASGAPLISEIYFNPPGGNDVTAVGLEYIELFGDANASLDGHYLIFLEDENDEFNSGNPGEIENIFNLSGMTFGSNGFLILGMKGSPYPALAGAFDVAVPANLAAPTKAESLKTLANGAHAYINRDTGNGYGVGTASSIGHQGQNADIEGSGFTAMLIKVDAALGGLAPVFEDDLDQDNNGLDNPNGQNGWTILDSVGVLGESDEAPHARLYGKANFGAGPLGGGTSPGGVEPGAAYIDTSAELPELEYVGRVGPGLGAENWMVANLTNDGLSGYTNTERNYAISGNHAAGNDPEVYVGFTPQPAGYPYGFDVTVTFGENDSLIPVPEPSSVVLCMMGGIGAVVMAYRRRRRA